MYRERKIAWLLSLKRLYEKKLDRIVEKLWNLGYPG